MRAPFFSCLLALSLPASGCTLLVGDQIDPLETDDTPDMVFDLIGFDPHIGQITELRLVNDAVPPIVQAVAIYDPLPGPDVTVELDNVVRPNVRRVDFYSDLNENGVIDPPEPDPVEPGRLLFPDHMWRRILAEDGTGEFMHSTDFTDIVNDDPGLLSLGNFQLSITGTAEFTDQPAQLWVTDASDRDVGYYFLGAITGDSVDITIQGIIDDGSEYIVAFMPGDDGDEVFCVVARGDASGLTVSGPLGAALAPCEQE